MKRPSCTLFLDNYQSRDNDNGFKLVLAGHLIIDLLKVTAQERELSRTLDVNDFSSVTTVPTRIFVLTQYARR